MYSFKKNLVVLLFFFDDIAINNFIKTVERFVSWMDSM